MRAILLHGAAEDRRHAERAPNVVKERVTEIADTAAERTGTDKVWRKVHKDYPIATHAHTVEYRLQFKEDLQSIHGSVKGAWMSGRGRTIRVNEPQSSSERAAVDHWSCRARRFCLARAAATAGIDVLTAPREEVGLAKQNGGREFPRTHRPAAVIHAAARNGGVALHLAEPAAMREDNRAIAQASFTAPPKPSVRGSSIFPAPASIPAIEISHTPRPASPIVVPTER